MTFINTVKNKVQKFAYARGYEIFRIGDDITLQDMEIIHAVKPYTLTDTSALKSLIDSVRHMIDNKITGCFVECGVWRGGSIMAIIKTLQQMNITDREIHLFDTFEGLNTPTEFDVRESGEIASKLDYAKAGKDPRVKIDNVMQRIHDTGYPKDKIIFHVGEVEKTLPKETINNIALLRLDTDWYESTKIEMEYLYPQLVDGKLHMFVVMKTNDLYNAWPENAYAFTALQKYMADELGVETGTYTHFSISMQIYKDMYEDCKKKFGL